MKGLENIKLYKVKNPRILRFLDYLLCSDFTVFYVRSVDNCIADYLSRLLNSDCEAPDFPRLLRTFREDPELVRIINETEIVDFELLSLVKEAKEDPDYVKLVSALEEKSRLPVFCNDDPVSSYGSVWATLTLHDLPNGKIVLLDGVQVVLPANAEKGLLSSLHKFNETYDAMDRLARNHKYWPGMKGELKK